DNALVATDTAAPYTATLDSTTLSNGTHSLVAKAYDAAGNVGTSSTVSFSVSNSTGVDTTPPTVSASESGTSGAITLSASASDNVGVTKVEFYVD
ncbi:MULTISPECIES: Ig-like domain-containing protein, partial [unclassified Rhodanobacter]